MSPASESVIVGMLAGALCVSRLVVSVAFKTLPTGLADPLGAAVAVIELVMNPVN